MFRTLLVTPILILLMSTGISLSYQAQNTPDARELLKQVGETYQKLKSYHFEAVRATETIRENVGAKSEEKSSESYTIAALKPDRQRGELKSPLASFSTVTDGRTEWIFVPALKQYTRKPRMDEKALMASLSSGSTTDMLAFMLSDPFMLQVRELYSRSSEFDQIARGVKTAKIIRQEAVAVKERTITCDVVEVEYIPVRGPTGDMLSSKTLWIDRSRALVLRSIARSKSEMVFGGSTSTIVTTNFMVAEINAPFADNFFTFIPPAGATAVDKLELKTKPSELVGKEASDFSLKDTEGRDFSLQSLRGRVVLLDFWATWCAPCLIELPHIEKLHREFKDQGLTVLGINNEEADVARDFMRQKSYTFTTLVDVGRQVTERYQIDAIPQVLIIGRDGRIATHFIGLKDEKQLRDALANTGLRSDPARSQPSAPSIGVPAPLRVAGNGVLKLMVSAPENVSLKTLTEGSSSKQVITQVQPDYPPAAQATRASGSVNVLVLVDSAGKVLEASVLSGAEILQKAALDAARQWTFTPLIENGKAVKAVAVLSFTFPAPQRTN